MVMVSVRALFTIMESRNNLASFPGSLYVHSNSTYINMYQVQSLPYTHAYAKEEEEEARNNHQKWAKRKKFQVSHMYIYLLLGKSSLAL